MSTSTPSQQDPAIDEILNYWFNDLTPKEWFGGSSTMDAEITKRFTHLVEKARLTDELDATWLSTPKGSLALIILLDQFTRNIYRPGGTHPNPGLSWSGDAKALRLATQSISKGYDRQIQTQFASETDTGLNHRIFFYIPFMHAEDMTSQIASCALFETVAKECELLRLRKQVEGEEETEAEKAFIEYSSMGLQFAIKHRDCVAAVGRFPKRNEPLGREHSEAEKRWLEEHPEGF